MVNMIYTRPFLEELAALSQDAEEAIWSKLSLVESFPGVGSSLIEPSLIYAFGPRCLKVNAVGFDIFYTRSMSSEGAGDEDVCVLGIVPQRAIR